MEIENILMHNEVVNTFREFESFWSIVMFEKEMILRFHVKYFAKKYFPTQFYFRIKCLNKF